MGSYGPIRAHMGPNPDRAPTRTGPQPGLGTNPDRVGALQMSTTGVDRRSYKRVSRENDSGSFWVEI